MPLLYEGESNPRYLSCFCHVPTMHSARIQEHKVFLPGGEENQDPLGEELIATFWWQKYSSQLLAEWLSFCKAFLPASFTSHLLCCEGLEPNCLLKKKHFCSYITCKRSQDTSREINLVHVNPIHPNSQFLHNSSPPTGDHLLQTPGNVGCCEHFSTVFLSRGSVLINPQNSIRAWRDSYLCSPWIYISFRGWYVLNYQS